MIMGKWSRANCFGYAVGQNRWLTFGTRAYGDVCIQVILDYGYRQVKRKDMVLGKEYIVFKYGGSDFHFAKRSPSGQWSHKPGGQIVRPVSEKNIFEDKWLTYSQDYTSTIHIFERV